MPRVYKPKPGAKTRKKYDEQTINQALEDLENSNKSISSVANKYSIPKSVLGRHKLRYMKSSGGQTALSAEAEEFIVENLNTCAEWGYPLTTMDLRYVVKMYLDSLGIQSKRFKNNFPGQDFVYGFLKRHKNKISKRICQNIKRARAAVSPETIKEYCNELENSIQNVSLSNIINYDETNLTDDPGRKQVIVKRGCKYPERVLNHTKGSVSLMVSAAADGQLLPPYIVYKSIHLYNTWIQNGPSHARYNRSKSGWFDGEIFADWIKTIIVPFFENKPGKKILIGDNLSSHLSADIIRMCKEKNIHFVFLPANSTHLTQPLDVAFFRPMKAAWRNILEKWKKTDGRTLATVPKGCFPRLLGLLMQQLSVNSEHNIKAGFRKTGIAPLNVNEVLSRLPSYHETVGKENIDESFVNLLKEMRFGTMHITEPKNKRKLEVVAGRSVSAEDSDTATDPAKKPKTMRNNDNSSTLSNTGKGKGFGKKTKQNSNVNTESIQVLVQAEEEGYAEKDEGNKEKGNARDSDYKQKCSEKGDLGVSPVSNVELNRNPFALDCNYRIVDGDFSEIAADGFEKKESEMNTDQQDNLSTSENKAKQTVAGKKTNKNTEFEKENQKQITAHELVRDSDGMQLFAEISDSQKSSLREVNTNKCYEVQDSFDITQMPVIIVDSLDCSEVIVATETKQSPEKPKPKPSKVKIISDIKLPLPLPKTKKSKCNKKTTNYYNDSDEIMKILED